MTDLLLYRINLVPELNYLKFLQLIGIELRPAQPATAEVTFPVKSSAATSWISVPLGTPVATDNSAGGDPVVSKRRAISWRSKRRSPPFRC